MILPEVCILQLEVEWLTGYGGEQLQRVIDTQVDIETFFAQAPRMNPNVGLIKGVVCGIRVEDIADPLMQKIRGPLFHRGCARADARPASTS